MGVVPAGVVSYKMSSIQESIGYLIAGYGLLIPFALIGIRGSGVYYKLAILFLFAAGLSPLIAPKTAIATWYRFLIGASPLMIPLAFKGAESIDIKKCLVPYLIVLIFPGLCFYMPYGVYSGRLIAALREFPPYLTPSPSSQQELEDLRKLSMFMEELRPNAPIIVDASTARWIHLGLRNPRPGQLTWLWREATLKDALLFMEKTQQPKVYLVTSKNISRETLNSTQTFQAKLMRDGIYKVYEVQSVE